MSINPEHVENILSGVKRYEFRKVRCRLFKKNHKAVAYKLGRIVEYLEPLKLSDFGIKFAPQSFVYVE